MSLRIRVASKRKQASGLTMLVDKVTDDARKKLLGAAEYALRVAVEHTPKWSGAATEGWHFSPFPRSGYTTTGESGEISAPKYLEGMKDSSAAALNQRVIASELSRLRSRLMNARDEKSLTVYLVNSEAYSAMWLGGERVTASLMLRSQNQDFYTMAEIHNEVSAYRAGFGFF